MTGPDRAAQARSNGLVRVWHLLLLGSLLLCSIALKNSIWQLPPQIFNDSPSYIVPAVRLLNGQGYGEQQDGFRTPTFPLYLAALVAPLDRTHLTPCTDAHRAVCIGNAAKFSDGQAALAAMVIANIIWGFGIVVLLYVLGWQLTRSYLVAFLFGAGYAFNIAAAFWEISIMSETLIAFLLLLSILLTLRAAQENGWTTFALGMVLALLALGHALFTAYAALPALYIILRNWRGGWQRVAKKVAPVLAIPLLCIGAWSTFNYFVNGAFTPSTVSGYVLIQTVYPVVQNAPEGYDGITQTLVGYRDAQMRETGKPAGAVFRAWRDMLNETDLTFTQVSGKLSALSLYLVWHYPDVYFQSVQESFARFWDFAFFHYDPVPEGIAQLGEFFASDAAQNALNIFFWLSPLVWGAVALIQFRQQKNRVDTDTLWGAAFLTALVWFAALFSSLTNLGDNARYRVTVMPLQYGVIVLTLWIVWRALRLRVAGK